MTSQAVDPAVPQRLGALLHGFAPVAADADRDITGLALDSRQVKRGDLFFACAGSRVHGMHFVDEVVRAGAAAVVYDAAIAVAPPAAGPGVPLIAVQRLAERLGPIAARFHREPSRAMTVVGITGTNGKTSCSHYLAQAFSADGAPCGVLGTLGYGVYGAALRPGSYTTPDALTLQQELARLRDAGAGRVVMEVSSHALVEGRTLGVEFDAAVFTNLSRDHLDYHGDLHGYGCAKRQLFTVPGLRFAVINRGDSFGRELIDDFGAKLACTSFALGEAADVSGEIVASSGAGMTLAIRSRWGEGTLQAGLLGRFNAENLLAVIAVLLLMEVPFAEALRRAALLRPVPGRMERFGGGPGEALAIVDYAHTPDALSQVLSTLRAHCAGRLICVFGCGGERDRGKRPLMGAVAARHADRVIITNDNPRGEDPEAVIAEILAGIPSRAGVEVIADRGEAIRAAIALAAEGDVVLVAGKGHEEYQQIGERRLPFSDRAAVVAAMGAGSWQ
jgi:UDP-N-acetylmuramoyl-L-alanyl-D-glutamate--2,6-diaminopimelate ligase